MVGSHRRKPAIEEADELAAMGQARAGDDPAVAAGGAAASGPQHRRVAGIKLTARADSLEMRFPPAARRSSADRRGPAARDRNLKGRRIPVAGVHREVASLRDDDRRAARRVTRQQRCLRIAHRSSPVRSVYIAVASQRPRLRVVREISVEVAQDAPRCVARAPGKRFRRAGRNCVPSSRRWRKELARAAVAEIEHARVSRNRPTIERTRCSPKRPGIPGRSAHRPRMMRSICTPAREAR